jgi:hypothetical protein
LSIWRKRSQPDRADRAVDTDLAPAGNLGAGACRASPPKCSLVMFNPEENRIAKMNNKNY